MRYKNLSPGEFCQLPTPSSWLTQAQSQWQIILVDHAHCERKAADFGINILKSYPDYLDIQMTISKLIREEMRHFELVLQLIKKYDINFVPLSPCMYAKSLHSGIRVGNRESKLLDLFITAAFIEARSCERFHKLCQVHPIDEIKIFYGKLFDAEQRHFQLYLDYGYQFFSPSEVDRRVEDFRIIENRSIAAEESNFRFHSGQPH
tara:strand:- start:616 stop:1230 length:615 start_codon:yes stop_codon:yes gene_type:complete